MGNKIYIRDFVCKNPISSTLVRDQIQKNLLSISVWGKGGAFSNSSMVFGSCIMIV